MLCNKCKIRERLLTHSNCRECRNESKYNWRKRYPERRKEEQKRYRDRKKMGITYPISEPGLLTYREKYLQKEYGISEEDYNLMYSKQNGLCAICLQFQEVLYVDHSHNTEEIRGLLCRNCNLGIGFFRDNIDTLQRAILYLDK